MDDTNCIVTMIRKFNHYYLRQIRQLQNSKDYFLKLPKEKQTIAIKHILKKNTTLSLREAETSNFDVLTTNYHRGNNLIETIFCPEKYFDTEECLDMKQLCLTKESIYSMSKPFVSNQIAELIIKQLQRRNINPKHCVLTDSTANVGGDTLTLSKYFKKINSVEVDKNNYTALCRNIKAFGRKNIHTIRDSYENVYDKLTQDIVYADPPWGGLYYNKVNQQMLYLGSMSMVDIFVKCNAKMFVYKLPINFNFSEFILTLNRTSEYKLHLEMVNLCSFVIMVVWKLEKKITNTPPLDSST